jgi:hypothetical protein
MLHRNTPGEESVLKKRNVAEEEAECQAQDHGGQDVLVARSRIADEWVLEQRQPTSTGGKQVSIRGILLNQYEGNGVAVRASTHPHCMMTKVKKYTL